MNTRANYSAHVFLVDDESVDRKVWVQEASKLSGKTKKEVEKLLREFVCSSDGEPWELDSEEKAVWVSLERDGLVVDEKGEDQDDDSDEPVEVRFEDVKHELEELEQDEEGEVDDHAPLWQLKKYRPRYLKTKVGKVTHVDNGDALADALRGLSLEEVYVFASLVLGETPTELKSRYGHLNNGQQRMNLGNRVRGFVKRKAADGVEVELPVFEHEEDQEDAA